VALQGEAKLNESRFIFVSGSGVTMADILIVDDEDEICEYLCKTLEEIGINASFCLTGEEALAMMEKSKFDLFVVDMKLPTAVTGLELIKAIRKKFPHVIIVGMSAYIDRKLKEDALRYGAQDYFEKPDDLKMERFSEKIKLLLQRSANP